MKNTLKDDHYCFVCGEQNPSGLHLRFSLQDGKVRTEFTLQKVHQGYKDIIHGGLISTLLDEAMIKAALMQGMPAVTAEITVRFKAPLMAGEKALVEAMILKMNKKIIETSAIVKKTDNTVIAEGHAKLLRQG
ncbi:MAG: PaaI family thioesterase [Nitrospira sp.]|nr:PaaI family thioesterase [Nitrospira sp.]